MRTVKRAGNRSYISLPLLRLPQTTMADSLTFLKETSSSLGSRAGPGPAAAPGPGEVRGQEDTVLRSLGPLLFRLGGERRWEQPRPAGTTTPSAPRRGPAAADEARAAAPGAEFSVRPQHERQRGGRRLRRGDHQPHPQTLR